MREAAALQITSRKKTAPKPSGEKPLAAIPPEVAPAAVSSSKKFAFLNIFAVLAGVASAILAENASRPNTAEPAPPTAPPKPPIAAFLTTATKSPRGFAGVRLEWH